LNVSAFRTVSGVGDVMPGFWIRLPVTTTSSTAASPPPAPAAAGVCARAAWAAAMRAMELTPPTKTRTVADRPFCIPRSSYEVRITNFNSQYE
jgi:hypothetical protein